MFDIIFRGENMASKKINIKAEKTVQKKEEVPVVQKPLTTDEVAKALRTFTDNGKTFFAGCFYPESFFSDVDKLKKGGFLC